MAVKTYFCCLKIIGVIVGLRTVYKLLSFKNKFLQFQLSIRRLSVLCVLCFIMTVMWRMFLLAWNDVILRFSFWRRCRWLIIVDSEWTRLYPCLLVCKRVPCTVSDIGLIKLFCLPEMTSWCVYALDAADDLQLRFPKRPPRLYISQSVMAFSPLRGGAAGDLYLQILKGRPQLYNCFIKMFIYLVMLRSNTTVLIWLEFQYLRFFGIFCGKSSPNNGLKYFKHTFANPRILSN